MKAFKTHTLPYRTGTLYQHLRCMSTLSSALLSINDTHSSNIPPWRLIASTHQLSINYGLTPCST